MAELNQIATLNTVASIRKAAQDSMRPVISEVEQKMTKIEVRMEDMTQQFFKFSTLQKKVGSNEVSNRHIHNQFLQLSEKLDNVELQMTIDRDQGDKKHEDLRQIIIKMQKQNQKLVRGFSQLQGKNNKILKNIQDTLERMREKEDQMKVRLREFVDTSEKYKSDFNTTAGDMKKQFDEMRGTLLSQLKHSAKRIQLLDLYEAEKELTFSNFASIFKQLEKSVTNEQFQFFKQCNTKDHNRVVEQVTYIINQNLSENTRDLIDELPQFKKELKNCLNLETSLTSVSNSVEAIKNNIKVLEEDNTTSRKQFQQSVSRQFKQVQKESVSMKKNIETALSLKELIKTKIDQYSDQLKLQFKAQNESNAKKLFQNIKKTLFDTRQQQRALELQRITEQRVRLTDWCNQVSKLGKGIKLTLTTYSSKFTKIRSDNELFAQRVLKELTKIELIKTDILSNNQTIGKIMAEVTEAIIATYCIQIQEQSPPSEEVLLTTENDGVILQKYGNASQEGKIIYRRRHMELAAFRKAVVSSLIQCYDQLMSQECCLRWHNYGPNSFFKLNVEDTYRRLQERMELEREKDRQVKPDRVNETLDFSTIPARQTISSSFDRPFHSRNINTVRSRRSRYTDFEGGQLFAHKSHRRVRGALNSSLGMT